MKSTLIFSLLTALSLFFLESIGSKKIDNNRLDSAHKIVKIANMRVRLDSIDVYSAGLCDTCVAGFRSAVVENRLLAKRLSEQNFELQELIQKNDSTIAALK